MKLTITGGAGFIGSNLCDFFVGQGDNVTCLDNLSTGFKHNIEHLIGRPNFKFIEVTVSVNFALKRRKVINFIANNQRFCRVFFQNGLKRP